MTDKVIEEIKRQMIEEGGLSEEDVSGISQDLLDEYEQKAVEDDRNKDSSAGAEVLRTNQVNDLVVTRRDGKPCWYYRDSAGSQCGRDRYWYYFVGRGDSYVRSGTCPQGYPWYTLQQYH